MKNVDILAITDTKLDNTFPWEKFYVKVFSMPYRLDMSRNLGVVMNIPSKALEKCKLPHNIEAIFIELNLRKIKWLL